MEDDCLLPGIDETIAARDLFLALARHHRTRTTEAVGT
jgi:hypothetical protein